MLKRIEQERDGKERTEIKELNLDNCVSNGAVEGLSESFSSLQNLSLINTGLNSLNNFPKLLKLKKLELSDNGISGSLENLTGCPSLSHINLSGNKIETIDALAPLAKLTQLNSLDLNKCAVTVTEDYRNKVGKLIPSLKYLDGLSLDEVLASDAKDDKEQESDAEEDDDDQSDEDSEEIGLSYLQRDDIEDDDEDEDYQEEDEEEDEDIIEDEDAKGDAPRGTKRKREDEE